MFWQHLGEFCCQGAAAAAAATAAARLAAGRVSYEGVLGQFEPQNGPNVIHVPSSLLLRVLYYAMEHPGTQQSYIHYHLQPVLEL